MSGPDGNTITSSTTDTSHQDRPRPPLASPGPRPRHAHHGRHPRPLRRPANDASRPDAAVRRAHGRHGGAGTRAAVRDGWAEVEGDVCVAGAG